MEYAINQLARLAGITPRTLRHYDRIGLLTPLRVSSSGYRVYGTKEVERLQQILFYRELDVELVRIKEILDTPGFDGEEALRRHLSALKTRRERLTALIHTAERTLRSMKGEDPMTDQEKFEGFKKRMIEENEREYGAEAREKYGDDQMDASNARMMNMTKEQYDAFMAVQEELNDALRKTVESGGADSPEARKAALLHRQWLGFTWGHYSPEAHRGLVDMYLADERFTAYYEAIAPGSARLLRDAVYAMLDEGE